MKFKKFFFVQIILCAGVLVFSAPLLADKKQQLNIVQNSQKIRTKGNLPLYFADSQTGEAVKNVSVTLYGDESGVYTTDKNGFIAISKLADGEYKMTVAANDYITENFTFTVKSGYIPNYRFAISRKLVNKKFRIVLQWGEQPKDLDLHFEREGGYHISYRDMVTADDGSANLDRDDVDSYGPETVTVNEITEDTNYFVYVVDYTHHNDASSSALSSSGAIIKIYAENALVALYAVPENTSGNRWNVCTIKNGVFSDNQTVVANY